MEKGMATIFRIGLLHLQFLDNRHEHESTIFKSSPAVQATDISYNMPSMQNLPIWSSTDIIPALRLVALV
jgi:hypothetical protein